MKEPFVALNAMLTEVQQAVNLGRNVIRSAEAMVRLA